MIPKGKEWISKGFLPWKQTAAWLLCLKELEAQYEQLANAKQQEKYLGSQEGKGITVIHVIHSPNSLCLWLKPHMLLVSLRNICSFSFPEHWLNTDWNQHTANIIPNHKTLPSVKCDHSFIRLCWETTSPPEIHTMIKQSEFCVVWFYSSKSFVTVSLVHLFSALCLHLKWQCYYYCPNYCTEGLGFFCVRYFSF